MSLTEEVKSVWLPSPNFGPRRNKLKPRFIVIHFTAMNSCELAIERLLSPLHEVSCHYLISEKGKIYQLVDEEMRAWHAGAGAWRGLDDINSRSIGIELANKGDHPFSLPQTYSLEEILGKLMVKWEIPQHNIIGHSDMAVGRKFDPGRKFDWRGMALNNLAIWPDSEIFETPNPSEFLSLANAFGYAPSEGTSEEDRVALVLESFRARFRPWESGELNGFDMGCLRSLASISNDAMKSYQANQLKTS